MSDAKISELTELTSGNIVDADLAVVVDVSDTTDAASGTTKKTLFSSIAAYLASLAQTLTNKTIDADNNTVSNIGDEEMKAGVDAAKIANGTVSNTEFQYLNGATSAIQTQLDGKAASSHTHAASDITSGTLDDARISESSVTQHEAALSITESQISDLDHTDDDAVHDNVSGEIAAVTEKASPVSGDLLLIEDSEASNAKKRVQIGNLPSSGGDVSGPGSATGDAIVRFDGTGGKTIQNSGVTIDDSDNMSGVNNVTGVDTNFVTGTAGTDGDLAAWNSDGDLVDGPTPPSGAIVGTTDSQTLTNKDISNANNTYRSASDSVTGAVELAIASEVTTGTDTSRAITPDALAGSTIFGRKSLSIQVTAGDAEVATGDGQAYITIPEALNGMNLVRAQATVVTAGTTNATTVMVHNLTDASDMLSGAISIASAGTVGTVGTIDTDEDDVATNDIIRIDVDSVSTTPPEGLMIILEFQLP